MSIKRIYNIASYQRPQQLIRCIESIFDQSDIINVALNCYDEIPVELYDKKINIYICDNSLGDAFKFIALQNSNGYFFSCDDDIIYPKDYSKFMIEAVNRYKRKNIISLHGRSFNNFPILSFYRSSINRGYCLRTHEKDTVVQFGGTGVMCFHTDLMKIPISYFEHPNMADVFIGKFAKENNIKTICAKHKAGFIIQQITPDNIYAKTCRNDRIQTQIVNDLFLNPELKRIKFIQKERKPNEIECTILNKKFGDVGSVRFFNKNIALIYQQMKYLQIK